MAKVTGTSENETWPLPQFFFNVTIGGAEFQFSEVSGLDSETQNVEYRHGESKVFSVIKMPGIQKMANVTMKKGTLVGDTDFDEWNATFSNNSNAIRREVVTIRLLDETGNAAMTWELQNAWITKITSTDLEPDNNKIAIETLELAYEALVVK